MQPFLVYLNIFILIQQILAYGAWSFKNVWLSLYISNTLTFSCVILCPTCWRKRVWWEQAMEKCSGYFIWILNNVFNWTVFKRPGRKKTKLHFMTGPISIGHQLFFLSLFILHANKKLGSEHYVRAREDEKIQRKKARVCVWDVPYGWGSPALSYLTNHD